MSASRALGQRVIARRSRASRRAWPARPDGERGHDAQGQHAREDEEDGAAFARRCQHASTLGRLPRFVAAKCPRARTRGLFRRRAPARARARSVRPSPRKAEGRESSSRTSARIEERGVLRVGGDHGAAVDPDRVAAVAALHEAGDLGCGGLRSHGHARRGRGRTRRGAARSRRARSSGVWKSVPSSAAASGTAARRRTSASEALSPRAAPFFSLR